MFEGYKVTAAEKRAIESAMAEVATFVRSDYELAKWVKLEAKGYGRRNDSVPLIAAKGMVLQWVLEGIEKPDRLLRDNYDSRPASIWARGLGARRAFEGKVTPVQIATLQESRKAYSAAFDRMNKRDMATI